jgi:hypothetical protein
MMPVPARALIPTADNTPRSAGQSGEPYLLRSSAKGDEFSILMPSQPTAVVSRLDRYFKVGGQTIDEERVFSSYQEGAVFLVKVLITSNGRKAFDEFLESRRPGGKNIPTEISIRDIALGSFKGKQEEIHGKSYDYNESFYSKIQYFATKRNIYIISAIARDENNPYIGSFFSSLQLGGMASGGDAKSSAAQGRLASAEVALLKAPEAGQVLKPDEVTHKAIIVWEPDPGVYEEIIHLNGPIFKLKVEMVLSASGQVTEVKILNGLTQAINEKVVGAVKYMRFIPAEKDGRPVSQWHTAEYVFSR